MEKEDIQKKTKFIEILLIIGSLLGTVFTISNLVQISEISLLSLCLFILFSIAYYGYINYLPLRIKKQKEYLKFISIMIAVSFAAVFSNVFLKIIIEMFLALKNVIGVSLNQIIAPIGALILIFSYFYVIALFIYRILTWGIFPKEK